MKQPYNTALYMRLSRDDETYGDSVSIETQRTILQNFAKENRFTNCTEYIDDGWSGTNFERPSFKRMMDDVDAGKINCIITKDLSRFGREHVMMDYYLEFVFPEKQIRYIAVAENEDTEKGLSDFVPFKNLFNEWFAKDTSRKVKTALHAKFAAGERTCTYAPLGYKKHPEIKNAIVIDEETRWIVEKIFTLASHGAGAAKITKELTLTQVPTPGWLNYQRYGTFSHIYEGEPETKAYAWTVAQVKSILKDETYIGNSVHNRQTNISYKNKKKVRRPEEEWIRVENTHEPIISKEVFDQVQKQISSRRREQKNGRTQMFSGLVKCADCRWSMRFGTNNQNSKPYSHFTCSNYGQTGLRCSAHYIRYDTLYDYVLARIRHWTQEAQISEEKLLNQLLSFRQSFCAASGVKFLIRAGGQSRSAVVYWNHGKHSVNGGFTMDEKKIGARIAKMRMDAGLTQAALAEKLGVSDKTVSKWENGGCYPDITILPAIADEFGVTIDYLLRGEGRKMQKMVFGSYRQVGDINEALADGWRVAVNPSIVSSDGIAEYIVILEKTLFD